MPLPRLVAGMLSIGMMVPGAGLVCGQNYPNKPIRMVTTDIGGGSDFTARLIASGLAVNLGQQVIVDNRPSGVIPGEIVSKAPPDGYTLLLFGPTFWFGPLLHDKTPYNVVSDFSPITLAVSSPNVLTVHPALAANSVKELVALAKAKRGELNYASAATGSVLHLAAELFKAMAGVDIVRINYKGTGQALNDLVGGQVQLMFPSASSASPYVKSGRLRALAVTSSRPSVFFPGLPTVADSGLTGYESVSMFGIFAPARTPARIINQLNQESAQVLNTAEVKQRFLNAGMEIIASSPQEFAARMKSEMVRMGKVIKDAGIRIE